MFVKKITNTQNAIRFFVKNYVSNVHASCNLPKTYLTAFLYLADWQACSQYNRTITSVQWVHQNLVPYGNGIVDAIQSDPCLEIIIQKNAFGTKQSMVATTHEFEYRLIPEDLDILQSVLKQNEELGWSSIVDKIRTTPPMVFTKNIDENMDLRLLSRNSDH